MQLANRTFHRNPLLSKTITTYIKSLQKKKVSLALYILYPTMLETKTYIIQTKEGEVSTSIYTINQEDLQKLQCYNKQFELLLFETKLETFNDKVAYLT